ncbi:MAG: hypothetical protein KDG55_19780 [Rhodocyclaceae bacterium]|nr:hypothetical protein [Rhodocyclaceae bacterium]
MDPALLTLLGLFVALAAVLHHVFVVRRADDAGGQGKAGLFVLGAVLIPVVLLALWYQSGAQNRLAEIGFAPHPAFGSSVGAASGAGKQPIWMFATSADPESILAFYREPGNHGGWSLESEANRMLVFDRGRERATITVGQEAVIITVDTAQ